MPPVGPPGTASEIPELTRVTSAQTIGAGDIPANSVFNSGIIRRIYCNVAGTLFVKRIDDAGFTSYTMAAGSNLDGVFVAIGGTTTGSTAMIVNCES